MSIARYNHLLWRISAKAHEISDEDLGVVHEATALAKRQWPVLCARLVDARLPVPTQPPEYLTVLQAYQTGPQPVCIDAKEGIYVKQRFASESPEAQSLWGKFVCNCYTDARAQLRKKFEEETSAAIAEFEALRAAILKEIHQA